MIKKEKGELGYLKFRKQLGIILTSIMFIIVFGILFAGILLFKSKTNYLTVLSVVMVLPSAKIAVNTMVLMPHKGCIKVMFDELENKVTYLSKAYDVVISNANKPIGVSAVVFTDRAICAFSSDKSPDVTVFENGVKDFLKNDGLNVSVTLFTDEKAFLKKAASLNTAFKDEDDISVNKMKCNKKGFLNMCL